MHSFTKSIVVLFVSLMVTPAFAKDNFKPSPERMKIDAEIEAIIDGCWAISEELRSSPNTNTMNRGAIKSANCIKDELYKVARPLYDDEQHFKEYFTEPLERAYEGYMDILVGLRMENKFCKPSCGTIETNIINAQLAHFYADIFRQTYLKNRRYIG